MDWVIKTVMNIDLENSVIVLNQETLVENVTASKDQHEISRKFKQFFSTRKNYQDTRNTIALSRKRDR
jgi:hypothetical protein